MPWPTSKRSHLPLRRADCPDVGVPLPPRAHGILGHPRKRHRAMGGPRVFDIQPVPGDDGPVVGRGVGSLRPQTGDPIRPVQHHVDDAALGLRSQPAHGAGGARAARTDEWECRNFADNGRGAFSVEGVAAAGV